MRGTVKGTLGRLNHPIVFGDVVVEPGDLVLGDDDGLVIVAQAQLKTVLKAALERVAKEVNKAAELARGVSSVELNKLDKVFESLGLVEK